MSDNIGFGWTAVAVASGLAPKQVARSHVKSNDIAYWRGEDGVVRAWHNRCPHRGMRLSFGFVRGDRLTCIYHGWTYDGQGGCVKIPAHPAMVPPRTITVNRYSAVESGGLIWVSSADEKQAPPGIEGSLLGLRSLAIEAPVKLVLAALSKKAFSEIDAGELSKPWTQSYQCKLSTGSTLFCAVQEVDDGSSFLHVALSKDADLETKLAVNAWSMRLRRTAERLATSAASDANDGAFQ